MKDFRKRQKRFKIITNTAVIVTVVYMLIYIGIQPNLTSKAAYACRITADILVILSLILLFYYISKYAKAEKYLENAEYAIADAGNYYTARTETTIDDYCTAVREDLQNQGYRITTDVVSSELTFPVSAFKSREYFYIVTTDTLSGEVLTASLNAAVYDCNVVNFKQKGTGVLLLLCHKADESAIALSKNIHSFGRKNTLQFAVAICELSGGKVYFLGNKPTKYQQMIANYVMNCDVPIKEQYIGKEQLPFQQKLEEDLEHFEAKTIF